MVCIAHSKPRREICAFVTESRRAQRVNHRDSVAGGGTVTRDWTGNMGMAV